MVNFIARDYSLAPFLPVFCHPRALSAQRHGSYAQRWPIDLRLLVTRWYREGAGFRSIAVHRLAYEVQNNGYVVRK
jgi:hypothetical protein